MKMNDIADEVRAKRSHAHMTAKKYNGEWVVSWRWVHGAPVDGVRPRAVVTARAAGLDEAIILASRAALDALVGKTGTHNRGGHNA